MQRSEVLLLPMTEIQDKSIQEAVRDNGKKLFNFIRNRVNGDVEAEDIYQDVMFELTQSLRLMQPIEKVAAWLFRVARNKITDSYRKKKTELLDDVFSVTTEDGESNFVDDLIRSTELSPDKNFDQEVLWGAIEEALDELPPEQREVFVKHELEGISFKEMAEETGESLNTLLSRKRYAVLYLRKKLQHLYNEIADI